MSMGFWPCDLVTTGMSSHWLTTCSTVLETHGLEGMNAAKSCFVHLNFCLWGGMGILSSYAIHPISRFVVVIALVRTLVYRIQNPLVHPVYCFSCGV